MHDQPQAPASGDEYVGELRDGYRHGQGTYIYASGSKYVGEWKDGKRHGKGTYTFTDPSLAVNWLSNCCRIASTDGQYVGEWKDGKRHGKGTYTSLDGDEYVGEFKDDKYHGQGSLLVGRTRLWQDAQAPITLTYNNEALRDPYRQRLGGGNKYVGEFKDGKIHGQGTITRADGYKYVGVPGHMPSGDYDSWQTWCRYERKDDCEWKDGQWQSPDKLAAEKAVLLARKKNEQRVLAALFDRCTDFGWEEERQITACMKQEAHRDLAARKQENKMRLLEQKVASRNDNPVAEDDFSWGEFILEAYLAEAEEKTRQRTTQRQIDMAISKERGRASRAERNRQAQKTAMGLIYPNRK